MSAWAWAVATARGVGCVVSLEWGPKARWCRCRVAKGPPKGQVTCGGSKEQGLAMEVQNGLATMGSSLTPDPQDRILCWEGLHTWVDSGEG